MSKFRQKDLRRVWRSEVKFGWAVPLRNLLLGSKGKTKQRIIQHIYEDERLVLTRDNTMCYVERRDAPRRFYRDASKEELEELGVQPPSPHTP